MHIAVVDDEAIVRDSIRDWLQDAGFTVSTAESGEQAAQLASKQDFGAMVVDLNGDGIDDIVYQDQTSGAWRYLLGTTSGVSVPTQVWTPT